MKQTLKDLAIVTWWAIRLYTKRFYNVISYGLSYRKMFQSSYLSIQHSRSLCIYAFYKKPEEA